MDVRTLMAAALVITGCDSPLAPSRATEAIRTDRSEYELERVRSGWRAEVPYTFTNRAGAPVELANCNGAIALRLDRWYLQEWVPAWYPTMPLCLSDPIVIPPGETHRDTLHFFAADPGSNAGPQMDFGPAAGVYRLVWSDVRFSDPEGGSVPLDYRTSNPFRFIE